MRRILYDVERISFNGVDLARELIENDNDYDSYFIVNSVYGRGVEGVENGLITVIGRDGAYSTYSHIPPRYIDVAISLKGKSFTDLRKKIDKLSAILNTGGKDVPIVFNDEPDRVYFGKLDKVSGGYEKSHIYQAVITFLCSDPHKYGNEQPTPFASDSVVVENKGTSETEPVFELDVLKPTTFAMVSNGNEYMMVGKPVEVDELPTDKYETVFRDNGTSLVGWTALTSGSNIDEGVVGGKMSSTGYAFTPESFGENPNGWVGPAIKKSLSRPIKDFRMTIDMALLNRQGNVGKVVVSLLDEQENVIASVQMVDATNSAWRNRAIIRVGTASKGHDLINHAPEKGGWNDFRGVLRIERIGNEFRAYVAKVVDGRHTGRMTSQPYFDHLNEYSSKVAQVRLYIAKSRHYDSFPMYFHAGNVWEIQDLENAQVPFIAHEGDKIIFDHKNGDCYINGEPVPFDFGADFFTLKKGFNSLSVLPEETFKTSVKYRDKFL